MKGGEVKMNEKLNKTYADCFQYKKYPQYSAILLDAIMTADRIDKESKEFEDVIYEVKRTRTSSTLLKVLTSKNTQLIIPSASLPKPFKVFCAKDARYDKSIVKVFIDCSNVIRQETDGYGVNEDVLVSYLINAEVAMIYNLRPNLVINNSKLRELGATCFANLFTHIIDYIGKISIIDYARDKCLYLAARYYLTNVLLLDNESIIGDIARKIAGIAEIKSNQYDYVALKNKEVNPFKCIKAFTGLIRDEFKIDKLTIDLVVEKWMYLYGQGTSFGLEYFPAFSAMLTDAYGGAFINNQKTIEKICGKNMVEYAKAVIYDLSI
jgi:hypothetical protein